MLPAGQEEDLVSQLRKAGRLDIREDPTDAELSAKIMANVAEALDAKAN